MIGSQFFRIAITPPYLYPGENAAIEQKLREARLDFIHIRKPEATETEVGDLVEAIDPSLRHRLTLHNHFSVADATGCGGIHLNHRNPTPPEGWERRLSRSCHHLEELSESRGLDYVFLSPVYPSISKPGYSSPLLAASALPSTLAKAPCPVVALGGVTPDRIPALQSLGFSGVAMLGAAWRNPRMSADAFKLQLISHPYPDMNIPEGVALALQGGCRWIQLRHKDADRSTLMAEGRLIAELRRNYNFTYIIDDHVDLVEPLGADGVHLGKNDMPVAEARRQLGPGKIIGATANTPDEIRRAAADGADYIGLGPFRFTTTKERLAPTLGIDGYREIIAAVQAEGISLPVVAIGGITLNDVSQIMTTWVDGVAVSGAILSSPSPTDATSSFIKQLNLSK